MREQRGGHIFLYDVAFATTVVEGGDEDLGLVAELHLGDFVLRYADFHHQAFGADDAHNGLQWGDALAHHGAQAGDGAVKGCRDGVVGQHGVGQVEGGLGLFEVGDHLAPFDLGEAAVVVHLLQAVVGVLCLLEGGLCRALCALHLR